MFLSYLCNPQSQATGAAGTGYVPIRKVGIDFINAEESMYAVGVWPAKALANAEKAANATISDDNQRLGIS